MKMHPLSTHIGTVTRDERLVSEAAESVVTQEEIDALLNRRHINRKRMKFLERRKELK